MDVKVPSDLNISVAEFEKLSKYKELEIKYRPWNINRQSFVVFLPKSIWVYTTFLSRCKRKTMTWKL